MENLAMNIVNGLYELAELSAEKRQSLNDQADEFVIKVLESELTHYEKMRSALERIAMLTEAMPSRKNLHEIASEALNDKK